MTNFVAYYNLCPIHDTKEFLGLSRDSDDGNIIATLCRNIVIVIKLSTQKQIRSWTVLDKLSSKVVFDCKSRQYVGVFGDRYLRCWDENTLDINKLKKIKFYKNIADLVCTEKDGIVLLYSDGSCESLSNAMESRKMLKQELTTPEYQSQCIVDANVFIYPDERRVLVYFNKSSKTGNTELITQLLDEESLTPVGEPVKYILSRQDQNASLAGYTVMEGHYSPCLLTIWSDKRIFTMPLTDECSPSDAPGNLISMLNILNVDNALSLVGLSKHCVAIYGANCNQEGASLILYNTQFKVVKAKQFFKIYFNFSRLWTVQNHILLAMGHNLSVVTFHVSKEMLSEMVGSQVSNELQDYIEDGFINEEDELEENLCFSTKPKQIPLNQQTNQGRLEEEMYCNDVSADGKKIPFKNFGDFEMQLSNLCRKNLHIEFVAEDKDDFNINFMANFNDSGFISEEIEIIAKELEKRGAGEQEITEKLIPILIKTDAVDDLAVCLRRYTNISEKILAKVLYYALTDFKVTDFQKEKEKFSVEIYANDDDRMDVDIENNEKVFPNQDILLIERSKVPVSKKTDLVNLVLSISINLDTLPAYIRKELDFKSAMTLLKHLYNLISAEEVMLEERPETSLEFDDDMKILQWLGIILISHFQDIVLSKDVEVLDLLVKWSEILSSYKRELKELEDLAAVLYNVVDKKLVTKDKKNSKWYAIEEVKLY